MTVEWNDLDLLRSQNVRDLWRQKDLGTFNDRFLISVASHGAEGIKIAP